MVKKSLFLLSASLLFSICFASAVCAADTPYVYDQGDLFTYEEADTIAQRIDDFIDSYDMTFAVVTTLDAEGKSSQAYADDFYDQQELGIGDDYSGMLYLIDLDNGELYLSTSGMMIRYITDERVERILDAAYEKAADGDYAGSTLAALKTAEKFMQEGIEDGQYNYSSETGEVDPYEEEENLTIVALIFGMIVGLIAALIKFFQTKSSYQLTAKTYHYPLMDKSTLDLTTKEDRLVNQIVTHRKIPKNPPPSGSGNPGRSTTHVSSSGRTHGGGGRKL